MFSKTRALRIKDTHVTPSADTKYQESLNQKFTTDLFSKLPFHPNCPRTGTVLTNEKNDDAIPDLTNPGTSAHYMCMLIGDTLVDVLFSGQTELNYKEDYDDEDNEDSKDAQVQAFKLPSSKGNEYYWMLLSIININTFI